MGYQKQAIDFLTKYGLEFRAVLVGDDCPAFCKDAETDTDMDKINVYPRKTHIHGKHYRCTISGKDRGHVSFDYWNSYRDEEHNYLLSHQYHENFNIQTMAREARRKDKTRHSVSAYDLLACLQKNDPGAFENFCSEFGYDNDSRKAEQVYHSVVKEWRKVEKFFTQDEIDALREIS